MSITPAHEPVEKGKKQVKVKKKAIPTKKATPKKASPKHDVDLSGIDYTLEEITKAEARPTSATKYILLLKKPDGKNYKVGLNDKPAPLDILNFWNGMDKRK